MRKINADALKRRFAKEDVKNYIELYGAYPTIYQVIDQEWTVEQEKFCPECGTPIDKEKKNGKR